MFTFNTKQPEVKRHKTLLYSHHGWGKTTQCKHYAERYGKGFIISGEGGLYSISDCEIDYLPFTSWDGEHDPEQGVCSFKGIISMMATPEFAAAKYNWIALDSLTELSDLLVEHCEAEHVNSKNAFAMWADYNRKMLGALKWIRDLPYHVLVTALAGEETEKDANANVTTEYWPLIKGQKIAKQLPGIFDNVFCGVRTTTGEGGNVSVRRFVVTDEVKGWHGKVRDPHQVLKAYEEASNITELLARIETGKE